MSAYNVTLHCQQTLIESSKRYKDLYNVSWHRVGILELNTYASSQVDVNIIMCISANVVANVSPGLPSQLKPVHRRYHRVN